AQPRLQETFDDSRDGPLQALHAFVVFASSSGLKRFRCPGATAVSNANNFATPTIMHHNRRIMLAKPRASGIATAIVFHR
ncbi:hypothetical protein, partial [Ferrimicrobium acidiphilum]|uniref:hypothetical protein n=1 Tax=Ferrimicrobium acidiphilum TaxID=121039 RepID=UPI0023F21E06